MSKNGCPVVVLLLLVICGLLVPSAQAQKTTAWSGAGGDNLWSNAANWTNNVPTDGVQDKVFINGTEGSPFTVNLNGVSVMVRLNHITVNNATISNGTWDWDGGTNGSLSATNVIFTDNSGKLYRLPPSVTISNMTYSFETHALGIIGVSGTHRYMGGHIKKSGGFTTSPQNGTDIVETVHIDGYGGTAGGYQNGKQNKIGTGSADRGQSFFILNNTRFEAGMFIGVGWEGNSVANIGKATFCATNSQVRFGTALYLNTNATLNVSNSTFSYNSYAATDGLYNRMTNAVLFDGEGLTFGAYTENPGLQYEVSGIDTGAVFAGFHDNYSIDQLMFGARAGGLTTPNVLFTNKYDNNIQTGNEALYVDMLTEVDNTTISPDPKFTLNLNGLNVYYKKYVDSTNVPVAVTNGTLTQVTGAAFFPTAGFVHAVEGAKAFARGDAPLAVGTDYGTVSVSGFTAGKPLNVKLTVSGTQPNIDALRTDLGGTGSGNRIVLYYPQGSNGGAMFFDWNFSHRSVTLSTLEIAGAQGSLFLVR